MDLKKSVFVSNTSSFIEMHLLGYLQVQNKIPSRRLCEEEGGADDSS